MSAHVQLFTTAIRDQLLALRPGETKLGSHVGIPVSASLEESLAASTAPYVLIGIPEDIGIRANHGVGGAQSAWAPALKALLNVQSGNGIKGDELLVLGAFDFSEQMVQSEGMAISDLRELVSRMDDCIYPVIRDVAAAGKLPIVIGGGHNNAYPLLKGASLGLGTALSCMNLDAHSDYRIQEGRHSGNGFRYAHAEGFLSHYSVTGLHENYNSPAILAELSADDRLHFTLFEDIFLRQEFSFDHAVGAALQHTAGRPCGIELDLDCVSGILSSAMTPSGITALQARRFLYHAAAIPEIAYLHLTEGAVALRDGRTDPAAAKLIAYLITDFIRERQRALYR